MVAVICAGCPSLSAQGAFDGLFLGLGAVALLVGAVGVANIMIISVLERRSEIGLRRALGATKGRFRVQFLAEAVLLALLGGAVGVGSAPLRPPSTPPPSTNSWSSQSSPGPAISALQSSSAPLPDSGPLYAPPACHQPKPFGACDPIRSQELRVTNPKVAVTSGFWVRWT